MREKVRARGRASATPPFMVQGERRITYGEFGELVWGAATAARAASAGEGRPHRHPRLQQPRLAGRAVRRDLGGRHRRRPERLVDGRGDRLRPARLGLPLPDRRRAPLSARRRRSSAQIDHLEKVFFIGANPPRGHAPDRGAARARGRPADDADRRGRPVRAASTPRAPPAGPRRCITTHRGTIAQVQGIMFTTS